MSVKLSVASYCCLGCIFNILPYFERKYEVDATQAGLKIRRRGNKRWENRTEV